MEGESRKRTFSLAMVWMLLIQLALGLMVLTSEEVSGSIRYVGPDSTYNNLQDALDDANSGDIIVISEGNFNGSFSSTRSNLYIRGNSSQNSTLILNGSLPSNLGGNGLTLARLTLANGTLVLEGDNLDLSELRILSDNGSLHLKNSSGSSLEDIELGRQVDPGIHIYNCSGMMLDGIEGRGIDNSGVIIEESDDIEIEWFNLTLRDMGTGLYLKNSSNVLIHAFDISSVGGDITGIKASSVTSIMIRNGSLDADGTGFSMDSCSGSEMMNISLTTKGNGSIGLLADDTSDLKFRMNNLLSLNDSTGIRIRDCEEVFIENSSLLVSGPGKGMHGLLSDTVVIRNGSLTMDGDDSTGINLDTCTDVELANLDLQAKGADSVSLMIKDGSTFEFFDSTVLARGARSSGMLQTGTSTDVEIKEIRFNLRGTESRGMDLEGINDSIFTGNQFRIEGTSSLGMRVSGSNLMLTGNSYTALMAGCTGAVLSGVYVMMQNDSAYAMEKDSIGIIVHDLTRLVMNETGIDCIGRDSMGMEVTGDMGTYEITNSSFSGDDDSGTLLNVDDFLSAVRMENSTLESMSARTVFRARTYNLILDEVSVSGNGVGLHTIDTASSGISYCELNSSLPMRFFNSSSTITGSDLGPSTQSLEAQDGSNVHLIDTSVNGVTVDPESVVRISNNIMIRTEDRFGEPLEGVDLRFTSDGSAIYETDHFNSSDPDTGPEGMVSTLLVDHAIYQGIPEPRFVNNTLAVYRKGTSPVDWAESFIVNTSSPGIRTFTSPDIDLPSIVGEVEATPLDTREDLRISWKPNDDDTLIYNIYRLDMEDLSTWNIVGTVDHPMAQWTTEGMGPGERGIFRVTAWDGTWESNPSSIVTAETKDLTPPEIPIGLNLVSVNQTSAEVSWEHPGSDDLDGFDIYLNKSDSSEMEFFASVEGDLRSHLITGLAWGTTYRVQVRAVDEFGNPSNRSTVFEFTTASLLISLTVSAVYSEEGPNAGEPVVNGTASLVSFNGTVIASGKTDDLGMITFNGLTVEEFYTVHLSPPEELMGELNEESGYIPSISDTIQMTEDLPDRTLEISLAYYDLPRNGSVTISVFYGEGPREGPAYQAYVVLLKDNDEVVEAGQTDADGERMFTIPKLPFRGRFEVTPAQGIAGDIDSNKSGYLPQITNFFEVTPEDPDNGIFEVELVYFDYTPPPENLLIASFMPKGGEVDLDADIVIKFSMPVNISSVEANVKVVPALPGLQYIWDASHRNMTIKHGKFLPEKEYTVTVEFGAMSKEKTTFPEDYTANTWTFTTREEDTGGGGGGISEEAMWIIIIGVLVVVVIIGFYLWSSGRRRDDELDEDDVYALSDEEYYDEEEEYYDEDEEFLDEEFGEFPEDEEGFEEFEEEFEEEDLEEGEEMPPEKEEPPAEEPEEEGMEPPEEEKPIIEEEEEPAEEEVPADDEDEMAEDDEEEAPKEKPKKKKGKKKKRRK